MRKWMLFLVIVCSVALINAAALATEKKGRLQLIFKNVVDGVPLELNGRIYTNANGDSFTVSMYKYYISNIRLIADNGTMYVEPESYHLINEAKTNSKTFDVLGIQNGKYTKISFYIGVDSLHNVSGAQSGALDAINAMFWDWNTGYIMAKIEGSSTKAPQGALSYHIGGYAGTNNTVRHVVLSLGREIEITEDNKPTVRIISNVAEWFKTPNLIQFEKSPVVTTEGKDAVAIADNYTDMFSVDEKQEK